MGSESDLYSRERYGTRYMQCLEAFSFNVLLPTLKESLKGTGWTPEAYFERVIKIHALFGGRIVITSITPIGSTVLLSLFANPFFCNFLKKHPKFLEFSCNFNRKISPTDDLQRLRVERVVSGLNRALDPKWISSLFDDLPRDVGTQLVRTVADTTLELIAQRNSLDLTLAKERLTNSLLPITKKHRNIIGSRHIGLLQAVPAVLYHFINNTETYVDRSRENYTPKTVYQTVYDSLGKSSLAIYEEPLTEIVKFIARRCGKSASFSEIIREAETDQELPPEKTRMILETACYAYNDQLIESVNPTFGSYVQLRGGIPVGMHGDHFHNVVTIPTEKDQITSWGLRVAGSVGLECDLDQIKWDTIADAMAKPDIARSAVYFQDHLLDKNRNDVAALENLEQHTKNLAGFFMKRETFPKPHPMCVWIIGSVGAAVGGACGFALAVGLGATDLASQLRLALPGAFYGAKLSVDRVHRGHKYAASEMLRLEAESQLIKG